MGNANRRGGREDRIKAAKQRRMREDLARIAGARTAGTVVPKREQLWAIVRLCSELDLAEEAQLVASWLLAPDASPALPAGVAAAADAIAGRQAREPYRTMTAGYPGAIKGSFFDRRGRAFRYDGISLRRIDPDDVKGREEPLRDEEIAAQRERDRAAAVPAAPAAVDPPAADQESRP